MNPFIARAIGGIVGTIVFCLILFAILKLTIWYDEYRYRQQLLKTDPPSEYQIVVDQLRGVR